jgi:hypothetical protein
VLDELQLIAEEEIRAFQIYSHKYRTLNQEPERPSPVKQGWEFMAYLLVSIASVLLASMRTAEIFYRSAVFSSSSPVLAYFEAFLAIFTVEGGIVVYAAVMASRSRKISPVVLTIGIVLLAAISIVAGLAQSLTLSVNVDPQLTDYVYNALIVLIGPGASFAALIGGHILGQQIAMAAKAYEDLLDEYEGFVEEYNIKLKKSWERSDERKTAKKNAVTRIMMQEQGLLPQDVAYSLPLQQEIVGQYPDQIPTAIPKLDNMSERIINEDIAKTVQQPVLQQVVEMPESLDSTKPVSMNNPASSNIVKDSVPLIDKNEEIPSNGKNNGKKTAIPTGKVDHVALKNLQHSITKWLIENGKTPFDLDLDIEIIGQEVSIDPEIVGKIIQQMKITYSKRL